MKYILLVLLLCSNTFANTAMICHPDGTCDIIITQDSGESYEPK